MSSTPETLWNLVEADERERSLVHTSTRIPTEYARGSVPNSVPRRDVDSCGSVEIHTVPQENDVESCGSQFSGFLTGPKAVHCPHCNANPGDPCWRTNGKPSKKIHSDRRDELSIQRMFAASRPRIAWRDRRAGQLLLIAADEKPCPLCGVPIFSALAHIDHIVPFGIGGPDDPSNLRVICRDCNLRRPRDGSDLAELAPEPKR